MLGFDALASLPLATAPDDLDKVIAPALYVDPDAFGEASLALRLVVPLLVNANAFGSHDVAFSLNPALFADPDSFGTPSLSLQLLPALYVDPDQFGSADVATLIAPTLHVDPDTFYTIRLGYTRGTISAISRSGNAPSASVMGGELAGATIGAGPIISGQPGGGTRIKAN